MNLMDISLYELRCRTKGFLEEGRQDKMCDINVIAWVDVMFSQGFCKRSPL